MQKKIDNHSKNKYTTIDFHTTNKTINFPIYCESASSEVNSSLILKFSAIMPSTWSRAKPRTYEYNYQIQSSYYKPVIDNLDKSKKESLARTYAEVN